MNRLISHPHHQRQQRSNALVFTLLALIIWGSAGLLLIDQQINERKLRIARQEADVLETIKTAANKMLFDAVVPLQKGEPLKHASVLHPGTQVVIDPITDGGELVWEPSIANLRDMGYLPISWSQNTAVVNNGNYLMRFTRLPKGCAGPACHLEGLIWISQPVTEHGAVGAPVDAMLLGGLFNHLGTDGGMSLPLGVGGSTEWGEIVFGHASLFNPPSAASSAAPPLAPPPPELLQHVKNPLPGNPMGVIAVRMGASTVGFEALVRMGDTRDPGLAGNLSVDGDLKIGQANSTVATADQPCVRIAKNGELNIDCNGKLTANNGTFTDKALQTTTVTPAGVATTGQLQGNSLNLNQVVEGAACVASAAGVQYASLPDGGLAKCVANQWQALNPTRVAGAACEPGAAEGKTANDAATQEGLICKNGVYVPTKNLTSNFVLMGTQELKFVDAPLEVNKPTCNDAPPGSPAAVPLLMIGPENEAIPTPGEDALSGINRWSAPTPTTWVVHHELSADKTTLAGTMLVMVYCWYP
jgi:hypothetical protein